MKTIKLLFVIIATCLAFNTYSQSPCTSTECVPTRTYNFISQAVLNDQNVINDINNNKPYCYINTTSSTATINTSINFNDFYTLSFSGKFNVKQTVNLNSYLDATQVLISNGDNKFDNISMGHFTSIYIDGDFSVKEITSNAGGQAPNDTNFIYMTPSSTFKYKGITKNIGSTFYGDNGNGSGTWIKIVQCGVASIPLNIKIASFKYNDGRFTWDIKGDEYKELYLQYSTDGRSYSDIANIKFQYSYYENKSGLYRLRVVNMDNNSEYSETIKLNNKSELEFKYYDFYTGRELKETNPSGLFIKRYSDGKVEKIYKLSK